MRERAEQLKVTGWVRNRSDGSVEAIAQGDAFAVGRFIEWAQRGPRDAKVDSVDIESTDGEGHHIIFDKKPSA